MTFSICVRESYTDETGDEQTRYGVAVTTRLAGVGTLCPFASESGAVATQSLVNVDLGRKGIEYLDDGLAVGDALDALLNADDGRAERQLHGVGAEGEFAFSGEECRPWYGDIVGDNYTVAGNLLTGGDVVEAVAETYEEGAAEDPDDPDSDPETPLAERLVDALAAGHELGGDKREDLHVQSAALLVRSTEDREMTPYYDDLRVDATETPIEDLRETYELAAEGYEMAMERYEEAYADDEAAGE
ncbi:hypothetical protein C475_07000 [Halosimplex carlsbadense 2-9-1]|uniref:DUF1028 domain-containing protein n=1 Tax=Halosimplex carlsbadense 2-9-1 TaxID=797114 RepID=M0CYE4_9EURY|nr:DUF1028 domain-containing protein [Halosimplex carlsbadense]ELZ27648.1 hypothetical protein C475_07000 [Halosimplex carlsbadense 2-9-1]